MSEYTTCPIWGTLASIEPLTSDGVTVDSPRAGGRYLITGRATETLKSHDEDLKARLTSWLIEQHRLGVDCPEISPTNVDEIEQRRSLSIHQRALSEEISRSEFSAGDRELGRPELTPLGECRGALELEVVPLTERSSEVEVVVGDRMDDGKFLEVSHPPETEHRVFSSPERPPDCSTSGLPDADRIRPVHAMPRGKTLADP